MIAADYIEQALGVASLAVIAGAGGFSVYAMLATIAPKWQRIKRLAAGHVEPSFTPGPGAGGRAITGRYLMRRAVEPTAPLSAVAR
jgi:hypothetical protein